MEMDQVSMDESGNPKWTYKKKKAPKDVYAEDPVKAIKNALMGVETEDTGRAMGIPQQQHMPMARETMISNAILSPRTDTPNLPFSLTPMNTQGGALEDYPTTVKNMLMKQYAPGYTPEQVNRDVMGLPTETPQEKLLAEQQKIPQSFTDDVKNLKELSKGDTSIFAAGLERLSLKYADNSEVLQRIKLMRTIFSGQEPFIPDETLQ